MPLTIGTQTDPYLPDILAEIVERIDNKFFSRLTDPFHVYFAHGNYEQVGRWVKANPDKSPLVWLLPARWRRGEDPTIYGKARISVWILADSNNTYTQDQRDALTIKPRIIPVYQELLKEIHRDESFSTQSGETLVHDLAERPCWGLGVANGTDNPNFFDKYVDAYTIENLELKVRFTS